MAEKTSRRLPKASLGTISSPASAACQVVAKVRRAASDLSTLISIRFIPISSRQEGRNRLGNRRESAVRKPQALQRGSSRSSDVPQLSIHSSTASPSITRSAGMPESVFVDTDYILALVNENDQHFA
jgi:hypothetical protein